MKQDRTSVMWEGPQFSTHSYAKANRNICKYLLAFRNIDLFIRPHQDGFPNVDGPEWFDLHKRTAAANQRADISVCHQWPPNWNVTSSTYSICMQPWEFGALPKQWYIPMKHWTDQVWVYSKYNKECYVRCGIPEQKIKVIPLGVDETVYRDDVEPLKIPDDSSFRFLFVGGTILRKGIDILLQAYLSEFSPADDVCLVIKDLGSHSFYKGSAIDKEIVKLAADPRYARILYLSAYFSEQELAGLYKACDVLVHPYRGEGFGLPILEAMACGTPAIVPDLGACRDFCDHSTSFLLKSEEEMIKPEMAVGLDTVTDPWWLKIDQAELQILMRSVYENRHAVELRGQNSSKKVRSTFTWKQTARVVAETLQQLEPKKQNPKASHVEIIHAELQSGIQLYSQNRFAEALQCFQAILSIYPQTAAARYFAALVCLKQNDPKTAREQLSAVAEAMASEPESFQAEIWSWLGVCYSQEEEFDLAVNAFQKSLRLNPALRSREILALKKALQQAEHRLANTYRELGECYFAIQSDLNAEEMLQRALACGSDPAIVLPTLEQVRKRIDAVTSTVASVTQPTLPAAPPGQSQPIMWLEAPLHPPVDAGDVIKERRNRWSPYFTGGDRVLAIEWRNQTDAEKPAQFKERCDGLLLFLKEKETYAADWNQLVNTALQWVKETGKIIIVAEHHVDADTLSIQDSLAVAMHSAAWQIRELNTLEDRNALYLVAQKVPYELLWQCPLFDQSGFAEEQRKFLEGIRPYPLRVQVHPIGVSEPAESFPTEWGTYVKALKKQRILTPLIHYQALPVFGFAFPAAPISIARAMFETDSLHENCVEVLNEMTEIWVPSEFNRETFARAGVRPERIHIIPGTVDEDIFNPAAARAIPQAAARGFRFLSVFDWSVRKGWDILLRAYFEEFTQDDDVSLIIKVTKLNHPKADPTGKIRELVKKLGIRQRPHIEIIEASLSEEQMAGLYAAADCFVLPSRGEGWGRPYMEAMAMELPTIGTRWSGQLSFMNDRNSYLIDIEGLVPVDTSEMPPHFSGHRWAEPSVDHLKSLMRHVYSHRDEARLKGRTARQDVFPRFSKRTIGRQIFQRIADLVTHYYN
ncbi:glycosyltransferase [Brevibacillus massiliensis]|uniref:glycosyltransferase n=1 Tax=Brevibacillus massiliensis TaxID=1118054 RepID=UPI0002F93DD5|nr:glycosyltransferase [Brevibacillus massiliensis]